MKKFIALSLALVLALGLCACGSSTIAASPAASPAASAAPTATAKPIVTGLIGFSFPTSNNEFWQYCINYFEEACKQLGCEGYYDDCNNDTAEQLTDVEAMISKGIKALILAPQDSSVCAGICGICSKAGIPVVIIDRTPSNDVTVGKDYITFIGPDDETCGYNQAVALIKAGATKLVAIVGYKGTSVAEGRYAGLQKALKEYPNVKLLGEEWPGENQDEGDQAFRNLYSAYSDLNGVWCYNDSHGLAVANVKQEYGIQDKVVSGGMDGLSPAVDAIKAGTMSLTSGGHYMMPAMAAVILFDAMNGIKYDGAAATKLTLMVITKDTADDYLKNYINSTETIDWASRSKALDANAVYDFATLFSKK